MDRLGMIGAGAMGTAIATGLIKSGLLEASRIYIFDPDHQKTAQLQQDYGFTISATLVDLTESCNTLVLAVKPHVIASVIETIREKVTSEHILISIAAGISLSFLENQLHHSKFVRVMPNTPARFGMGISVYSPGRLVNDSDCQWVEQIFNSVGKVIRISESQMDAATALSGSGPAYVFHIVEAMIDAGVLLGLTRHDATVLVTETLLGSAEMLRQSGEHPAKLRNDVTSPGGTTAAALYEFQKGALSGVIMNGLVAAARRSAELGQVMEHKK